MQVEGVLHGNVIALRQGTEAVYTLHGVHGGEVKAGRAAGVLDAHVGRNAIAIDVEDYGRSFTQRCAGIGFGGVPVLRHLAIDDVDVVRKASTKGTVFYRDAGCTVFDLQSGLRDANTSGLPCNRLVGLRWEWLDVFRGFRRCFFCRLDWLCELFRNGQLFWIWRRLGLFFRDDGRGAWRLRGEDAGVQTALRWW